MTSSFERLLNPRGIAVVGASPEPSRPGAQAVSALQKHGYRGAVYPVNPKYPDIAGYKCYPALSDIEDVCDVAVISLPASHVPGVVAQCGARGIPFAVVQGGGFREAGEEGEQLEADMLAAARRGGVRLIGPNCLGYVNVHTRAYAAFGSLTRPPLLQPGPVSAVLQSASFGVSVLIQCDAAGLGFRYVVTSGNEADITAPELIDAYVDDPETRVILAYLEGVRDGRGFMAAARRALAAGKPLIVLKAGNTESGRRAAESHTANLAGSYDVYRAAFRQCGVIEVRDVQEAVDTATCFAAGRLPRGRRVIVMGGSGGAAAMYSDQADESGLALAELAPHTIDALKATLPALASLKNPIDYTAGYPREGKGLDFVRAFRAAIDDPNVDQLAVMFAAAGRAQVQYGGEVLAQVVAATDKPIVVFSGMTEALAPEGLASMREARIPVLASPKRAASAMAAMAAYADARKRSERTSKEVRLELPAPTRRTGTFSEVESKRLVAAAGIAVTTDTLLPLDVDARGGANLAYPLALKIVSPDIAHKTDVGGVRLNVRSAEELASAAAEMVERVRKAAPEAKLEGLLASPMVIGGTETLVGVINDAAFGPVVAFGLGGILTEVLHDMAYRVAPFDADEARAMMGELRARALFDGVRGGAPLDVDALADTLARVSALAWQMRNQIAEMDINPLLVLPKGQGVIAADALVVMKRASR
jgi:acetate---CoA ligase (ADP-forming)